MHSTSPEPRTPAILPEALPSGILRPDGTPETTPPAAVPAADGLSLAPTPTASLGRVAAGGFAWMIGVTIWAKLLGLLQQFAQGRFLSKEEVALAGLAASVTAFIVPLAQPGLKQVLVQRQKHLRRWLPPAFWLSTALGLGGMLLCFAIAPVATSFLHQAPDAAVPTKSLVWLVMLLGIGMLATGLVTLPDALMAIQLKFRAGALLGAAMTTAQIGLTILLAWRGWGAYAMVVPMLIVGVARVIVYWALFPSRPGTDPKIRRWRYLYGDTGFLLATTLLFTVTGQADNLILGVMHTAAVTGDYLFSYGLSLQTTNLLTANLANVLFPALNKLRDEPERQAAAFLRASRVLAVVGVPICLLQAVLAERGLHLFFGDKWESAVHVLQILSIGSALQLVNGPAVSLLQAQGRFRTTLIASALCAVGFLAMIFFAAKIGAAASVATGVTLYWALTGLAWIRLAVGNRLTISDVGRIYLVPLALAALATLPAYFVGRLLPGGRWGDLLACAVMTLIGSVTYLVLLRVVARGMWDEMWGVVTPVIPARIRARLGL